MFLLNLNAENRILLASKWNGGKAPEGSVVVNSIPDGNVRDYLYINGQYEYDPLPPAPEPEPTPEERIAELEAALDALLKGETDE